MTEIISIPVSQIIPGANDRKIFDRAKLEELAASIAEHGLAQPITVRPIGARCPACGSILIGNAAMCFDHSTPITSQTVYQIVAGERRFRAISEVLKLATAPCIVREDLDDEAASAIMLAENTGRADLNPIEEANAYQARSDRFGWTPEHIAEVAGVSVETVKQRLSLLRLIPDAQTLVAHGHLPIGHAAALAGLDSYRQVIALRVYQESKHLLTLADFRAMVCRLEDEQNQDSLFDLEAYFTAVAQQSGQVTRGKEAAVRVPTRADLPPVRLLQKSNASTIIAEYIAELQQAGHDVEAATIGTLYDALIRGNFMRVPLTVR